MTKNPLIYKGWQDGDGTFPLFQEEVIRDKAGQE